MITSHGKDDSVKMSGQEVNDFLCEFRLTMENLEVLQEACFQQKYNAEVDLKEFETQVLGEWRNKMQAYEYQASRHAMQEGLKLAMHAALKRHDFRVKSSEDQAEELKVEHVGSQDHPHGCRPCHFGSGLCRKELTCPFCHICQKPKRRSKHQRDFLQRQKQQQVKEELGAACLDELTKIDEGRDRMMTLTNELQTCVKDAYASRQPCRVGRAIKTVKLMQGFVQDYNKILVDTICVEEEIYMRTKIIAGMEVPETTAISALPNGFSVTS